MLLVTDAVITQLGLAAPLTEALAAAGVQVTVFDAVTPDAPIPVVEQGLALYRRASAARPSSPSAAAR